MLPPVDHKWTSNKRAPNGDGGVERKEETPASLDLPTPFLDLLLLLPEILDAPSDLSHESVTLLLSNPPLSDLPVHLPQLARLVSSTLHSSAVHLARIANPTTNPSFVHRSISALPTYAASLASTVAERKAELTRSRLSAAAQLAALMREQTGVLSQLLRILEAKHGPVARSLEFRATEAALTAQRQEAEAETTLWLARRETYTPEAVRALANYASHLRDAKGRLNEAIRALRTELEAYGLDEGDGVSESGVKSGKEKVMREMAQWTDSSPISFLSTHSQTQRGPCPVLYKQRLCSRRTVLYRRLSQGYSLVIRTYIHGI
ncbi:hypothetical protein VTH06DRAFT_890 [Thermothelomyces fergusii]